MIPRTIALIGTLDTKGEEFAFLRDQIEKAGLRTIMIDVGVLGRPPFDVDISPAEVAAAANEDLASLRADRDRGRSVTAMALGATVISAATLRATFHSRRRLSGRFRWHDYRYRGHACAAIRFSKTDGFHSGLRRHYPLRGNQRHLHDAFGSRHRRFESRLPPNPQQCSNGVSAVWLPRTRPVALMINPLLPQPCSASRRPA